MARKQVGVRLVAENGAQVKAELEGVGDAGEKSFGRIEARARVMSRVAIAALAAMAAAAVAMGARMVRSSLDTVDAQAKLARSLGTTTESIQILQRAGDLAGVSMGQVEQGAMQLTRRLSQAAAGTGPAVKALDRLGLSARDLIGLPLDQRIATVQDAIQRLVPAAERAAVASQLFGDRAGLMFARIDSETLRTATKDVEDFGVAVSDADAAQIERTNDALTRLGLIWTGIGNQMAVAVAPALEAIADAMAAVAQRSGPLGQALNLVFSNLHRLVVYAGTFVAFLTVRWVAAFAVAAAGTVSLTGALSLLRVAIIRTGFGALIIGAGELVIWFGKLVSAAGGFGEAMVLLGETAAAVWSGIVTAAGAIPPGLEAVWQTIRAGFFTMVEALAKRWADFLHSLAASMHGIEGLESAMLAVHGAAVQAGSRVYELGAAADEANAKAAALGQEAAGKIVEGFGQAREALARLGEVVISSGEESTTALDGVTQSVDEVTEALGGAGRAGGGAGRAVKAGAQEAKQGIDEMAKAAEEAQKRMADMAKEVTGDVLNPMKDWLKSGELSWRGFAQAVGNIMQNLASRLIDAAFKPIENALMSMLTGGGRGGGFFQSLFGSLFAKGGVFSGGQEVTAFARGGVVNGPTIFPFAKGIGLMGEAGPEAIMPLKRGRDGRLGVEMSRDGSGGAAEQSTRIINVLDPSIVGDYLGTPAAERQIVNVIRRNRGAIGA